MPPREELRTRLGVIYFSMTEKSLTLQSSNEELKAYFEAVCRIADSNTDEFPINLDEVWPLSYTEKGAAVRALKNGFIEDVDYKAIDTFTKREIGSTRTTDYFITVSCLEYLIARKHRNVFEVYRQVFHAARKGKLRPAIPQTYSEALRQLADEVEAREKAQLQLAEKTEQLDESKDWFSIKRWAQIHRRNWRNYNWRKLKAVSHELGYAVKKIFDANYSEVNIYHKAVFEAVYGK